MIGKIIKIVSNQYTVYSEGKEYDSLAMGKVRLQDRPFVGDQVEFELIDEKYCIQRILERRNQMYRPAITSSRPVRGSSRHAISQTFVPVTFLVSGSARPSSNRTNGSCA